MESQTKLLSHPVHPILITFPIGLLSTSVAFDVAHRVTGDPDWGIAAEATLGTGLIGGLVAAPFGLADWLAIPDGTRAKQIGALHGIGNAVMLGLYGASWLMRREQPEREDTLPYDLSLAGLTLSLGTAWLGGELVDRLGVGVDPGANIDAPSSLSDLPADASLPQPFPEVLIVEHEEVLLPVAP